MGSVRIVRVDRDQLAFAARKGGGHCLRKSRALRLFWNQTIDDEQSALAHARQFLERGFDYVEPLPSFAVDEAREPLTRQPLAKLGNLLTAPMNKRCRNRQSSPLVRSQQTLHHRLHGRRLDFDVTVRATRLTDPGEQQPQVIKDFGRGAHCRARVTDTVVLLDRDRRWQIRDRIHIGARQALEELSRIG